MPIEISPHTGKKLKVPIKRCDECKKPIVRMRKVSIGKGMYKLIWSQAKYCSNACRLRASRRAKVSRKYDRIVIG
jgi:hypothetical protein